MVDRVSNKPTGLLLCATALLYYYIHTRCDCKSKLFTFVPVAQNKVNPTNFFFGFQFTDERDAIQKKTFTKWVNKHLRKVGKSFWYVVTICPEIFAADMDGRRRRLALLRSFAPSVDVYMTHLNMSRIFMGLFSSVRDSGSG